MLDLDLVHSGELEDVAIVLSSDMSASTAAAEAFSKDCSPSIPLPVPNGPESFNLQNEELAPAKHES